MVDFFLVLVSVLLVELDFFMLIFGLVFDLILKVILGFFTGSEELMTKEFV